MVAHSACVQVIDHTEVSQVIRVHARPFMLLHLESIQIERQTQLSFPRAERIQPVPPDH